MCKLARIFTALALGLILMSCSNPAKPEPEPPLLISVSYDSADWLLQIEGRESTYNPNMTDQSVTLTWLGYQQMVFPDVFPLLYIDGEAVPLTLTGEVPTYVLTGFFEKAAGANIHVVLRDEDPELLHVDTTIRLVSAVRSFHCGLPFQYGEENLFTWSLQTSSPFQIFEMHKTEGSVYKYISPSARSYIPNPEISAGLNPEDMLFFIIRQVNYRHKNRVAIYSSSFADLQIRNL